MTSNTAGIAVIGALFLLSVHGVALRAGPETRSYLERADKVIDEYSRHVTDPTGENPNGGSLAEVAARLASGRDPAWCSRRLIYLTRHPSGDMFWMLGCVPVAYLGRSALSPEAKTALRTSWQTYMPIRGDTENHYLMYYSSLYLMAQLWPHQLASDWFTGKDSDANLVEARSYIYHWMNEVTRVGQIEYDAPLYEGFYLISLLNLATWSADREMRQFSRAMLDYFVVDFAANTLGGAYVGANARVSEQEVLEKWNAPSSFYSWLFFGTCPPPPDYGTWGIYFAVGADHYSVPPVAVKMATDRTTPYLLRERRRGGTRWRRSPALNPTVFKTTYMTRDYAVSSDQGGLLQALQQHSWDITWIEADPRGKHNTLFSVNPYWSADALESFFNEYPQAMAYGLRALRPEYFKSEKWVGGSPYEQILQHNSTIVALYNDLEEGSNPQVNVFFSKNLIRLETAGNGWIVAQGGRCYLACRPLRPYSWVTLAAGDRCLHSPWGKNGLVAIAAAVSDFQSWDAFRRRVEELHLTFDLSDKPIVRLTCLDGSRLSFAYDGSRTIDGADISYRSWPLVDSSRFRADSQTRSAVAAIGDLKWELKLDGLPGQPAVEP